ncbi:MAG: pyridoxal phosphate-dependent aminotransferase [Deltaproteobacteria bacterium]|nr:pyridoxal phosphate-dependent aminotransferase [Deltaproteobacteria bacterium]
MARFPRASDTTSSLSSGVFSALAERARSHAGPVYPLHVGDTWREPWLGARASEQRGALIHTYAPVQGEPALLDAARRRIAARAGRELDPEAMCVMSGATSGLSVIVQALLDPGDEVLLPAPFWPLIRGIIASRGAAPVQVPLWDRLGDPGFDLEAALERAVTPRTAAIYVNSPNNPTGAILSDDQAAALTRVAARHDLWILADEVYEELYYGAAPPPSFWARDDAFERAVVCHSMSKAYGLAGARVGYAHGPRAIMRAVRAVETFQVYCAPRPMQLGAARALDGADAWLAETRALYNDAAALTARAFGVPAPPAGTFLFVDASPWLAPDAPDALPFLYRCLDEAGVLFTPGSSSGDAYGRWIRACFTSVAPDVLARALAALAPVLADRVAR